MGLTVHRDERSQLQKARIDLAANACVFKANALDHCLFQLAHGDRMAKVGHFGRGSAGVNGTTDQGEGLWLRLRVQLRQIGGRGQGQGNRLANGDHVDVAAQVFHEINEVEGVILNVEFAFADRNVAGVVPIGGVNLAIGQEAHHGFAQEGRVVARHRCHEQHTAFHRLAACDLEVHEIAKGTFDDLLHLNDVVFAVARLNRRDTPVRFRNHARESPFSHFAPSTEPFDHRIGGRGQCWIRGKCTRCRT